MLVYGDRARSAQPAAEVAALRARLEAAAALPLGLERHAALIAALIAAGELAQGLADAEFERTGQDARSPAADLAMGLAREIALAVIASWRGEARSAQVRGAALTQLGRTPRSLKVRQGEGYAFYALYPETYALAAAAEPRPTVVIGLRSIGTSLAAMVAAASGAATLVTLRPTGHPFRRELRLGPALEAELLADPAAVYAVVDEGPGLSGSSFGAVLDWLEARGVERASIQLYPGHPGEPGGEAPPPSQARWRTLERRHVAFEEAVAPKLAAWVEDIVGPATAPLQDLSGGAWRALHYGAENDDDDERIPWPAADTQQERRKYRLRSANGEFLLKFAGLGGVGERKLKRARTLAEAGFSPEVLGLRHGFLIERWVEPMIVLEYPRARLLERVADYLAFRARAFLAEAEAGADLRGLFLMLRANVNEGLGREADEAVALWRPVVQELDSYRRPVLTDNRLHWQEWITDPEGRWLKTDALDHVEGHDLVGAQDIGWDIAGAIAEFDLDGDEAERLRRAVGAATGLAFEPPLLAFYEDAYCAFQMGAYAMAAEAHAHWPEEAARLATVRDRYKERLRQALLT